jgi:hypothetical protein
LCPSKLRHTAQQQPLEVIVQYPHHPHAGERFTVVRPLLYAGDAHFVVELPAGGRLLLPAWMTETSAATPPMVVVPRLSFACLLELRLLIDQHGVSLSPSLKTIRNDGGDDGTAYGRAATRSSHADGRRSCAQLFDVANRAEIVSLLKALLNDCLVATRMPEADDD